MSESAPTRTSATPARGRRAVAVPRLVAGRSGAEKDQPAAQRAGRAPTVRRPRAAASASRVGAVVIHAAWETPEDAARYLLSQAEGLLSDGAMPRLPVDAYLDALWPVLDFIHQRAGLFAEANLGPKVCAAAELLAHELADLPEAREAVLRQRQARTQVREQEAVSTGALLLSVYRDAVRRVARGPRGNEARERFGLADDVDARDGRQVAASITRFLGAARAFPAYVREAGLSAGQLRGLAAQGRVIRARTRHRHQPGTFGGAQRYLVLHTALEYFFDRFSAAVTAKLFDLPVERLQGLRLCPRQRDRQRIP